MGLLLLDVSQGKKDCVWFFPCFKDTALVLLPVCVKYACSARLLCKVGRDEQVLGTHFRGLLQHYFVVYL